MKSITINIYNIEELSKEAQELAFEKYQYFNVELRSWYDSEFENFIEICKTIGINIAEDGIYFRGFCSQGDGSTFKSRIDAEKFIEGISREKWKEFAPRLEFNFAHCPCDKRVIALILNGEIEYTWSTDTPNRGYWIDFDTDYYWVSQDRRDFSNIFRELDKLDRWAKEILNRLNRHLYKLLEQQYVYETSPEALKQTFIANEYLFTEDGKMAERLLNLAV